MVEVAAKGWDNDSTLIARHTSRDSQRMAVVAALKAFRFPVCDRAIASYCELPVNLVTARRNELVKDGLVVFAFKARSPFSHILVKHWRYTR